MAKFELETIIHFDEDGDTATLYTAAKNKADMLIKRGMKPITITKYRDEENGWTFILPKWCIAVKPEGKKINIGGRKKR